MHLDYPRTFLLGCAFFGVQVLFAIYNAYVPIFLQSGRSDFQTAGLVIEGFQLSAALTGVVMTLDNLAALLILPIIGALSDATSSPLGKRKPYILAGAPVAAFAFALIPLMLSQPLALFMLVVVLFILAVDVIRTPIIALMPDITPSPLRSQANGVINLMGGLGAVVAFLVAGELYRRSATAPFLFGGAVLFIGCVLVVAVVPVPAQKDTAQGRNRIGRWLRDTLRDQAGILR
jgi:Na+/melibiose symporter-like transporter